jgi:hypothetical protein
MPPTQAELDRFRHFALDLIEKRELDSLEECVDRWESQASLEAIRKAIEDSAAGRSQPVDEAFAEIRRELGLSEHGPVA